MSLLLLGILLVFAPLVVAAVAVLAMYLYVRTKFMDKMLRIFEEKPLFIIPRGEAPDDADDIAFKAKDGRTLRGCYLRTPREERKGVILFGLEYGSNRWSCRPYAEELVKSGYDVFAFEPRNQGDSDCIPNYDPLHWLTRHELDDTLSAVEYLKARPDADPNGIGYFGVSKGGSAGLVAAANHSYIRAVVTDGAFGTMTTVRPYMRHFAKIYTKKTLIEGIGMPDWFLNQLGRAIMNRFARKRNVEFLHVEPAMRKLKRPLMMIHGEKDSYIKPAMARALYAMAAQPKHYWEVPGAKHNQALNVAGMEYHNRLIGFFDYHLAGIEPGLVAKPDSVDVEAAVVRV